MNTFNVLTFIQVRIDNNKFMQGKKWSRVRIYFYKWFMWIFYFFKDNKITTKSLTCLKSVSKKPLPMYCESMKKIIESKMTYLE